jgi:hypothetical protein
MIIKTTPTAHRNNNNNNIINAVTREARDKRGNVPRLGMTGVRVYTM